MSLLRPEPAASGGGACECCDTGLVEAAPPDDQNLVLRQIDPRLRLIACLAFALIAVSLGHPAPRAAALGLALAAAGGGRLALRPTLRRLAALDGFMVFVLALLPFTVPGQPMFDVAGATASAEGIRRAVEIVMTSNAVLLMMLALVGTLEPSELGRTLARLGLPDKFAHLFLFTVRYLDVLGHEYRRLRTAMRARGFRMGFNLHTWRSVGYLFGMLLVRSIERAERILAAMRCRGFQGRFPSLDEEAPLRRWDHGFAALSTLCGAALLLWDHL